MARTQNRRPRPRRQLKLEFLESRLAMDGAAVYLADDAMSVDQGGVDVSLDLLANDVFPADYAGERRITAVSNGPQGSSVTIVADGRSVRFSAAAGFAGQDNFIYIVDNAFSAQVRVTIRPIVVNDTFEVRQNDREIEFDVFANDQFANYGGARRITAVSYGSADGVLTIAADGRSLRYSPAEDFRGQERFSYIVDDALEARIDIRVRGVASDYFSVTRDQPEAVLDVLANDRCGSLFYAACVVEPLRITAVEPTQAGGAVAIAADGGTLLYTPPASFIGTDRFRYVANGQLAAEVTVQVRSPDEMLTVIQNSEANRLEVLANDFFPAGYTGPRRISSVTAASQGTATIADDGRAIVYTPAADFSGSDQFRYEVDGQFAAEVRVFVRRLVLDDEFWLYQNEPARQIDVLTNDAFPTSYAGEQRITAVDDGDHGATVTIAGDGRGVLYAPARGFNGSDSFTYTVDGQFAATVFVRVESPVSNDYFYVGQFTGDNVLEVRSNDDWRRQYAGPKQITAVGAADHGGTVSLDGDGRTIRYTPAPDFSGQEQFTYTLDGQFVATVRVGVGPQVREDSLVVDQNSGDNTLAPLANDGFSDNYRGGRRITAVGPSEHGGQVSVSADGKSVRYRPAADFYGKDSFTYTVDGLQTATVRVSVVRHVRDDRFHVEADSTDNRLPVLVNDDFGPLYRGAKQITAAVVSGGGSVRISPDGRQLLYSPAAGSVGEEVIAYTVDGALQATATIRVGTPPQLALPSFESAAELARYLLELGASRYESWFARESAWYGYEDGSRDIVLNAQFDSATVRGSPQHSDTNVQVAGVDEGDIVETDGNFVYVLRGQELVIADSFPAEQTHVVSRYSFADQPIAAYLRGDRLTMISQPNFVWYGGPVLFDDVIGRGFSKSYYPRPTGFTVTVLDVSDRAAPRLVQETKLDGEYVDSRAIGDFVHVVTRHGFEPPEPQRICTPLPESNGGGSGSGDVTIAPRQQQCVYESREQYLARGEGVLDGVLPHFSNYGPDGELVRSGLLTDPAEILRPDRANASQLTSLVSFEISRADTGPVHVTGMLSGSSLTLYASRQNLYLFEPDWSGGDDGGVTSRVQMFSLDADTGKLSPAARGSVPGTVLNSFSIDETDGLLRVATTSTDANYHPQNNVFILQADGGELEFVGGIQNLAPRETIFSVRFLGERAFVVTFRQIDPLLAIDLHDPEQPSLAGSLKVPGFASYLQPVGENHLLAFGRGGPDGWNGPPQISLFEIRDLNRPVLIDQTPVGNRSSDEAWRDHHAVAYFPGAGVLAIPSSRSELVWVDSNGDGHVDTRQWQNRSELYVFRVDVTPTQRSDDGLQTLGTIADRGTVLRAVRIEDRLYSISDESIQIVELQQPQTRVADVPLGPAIAPDETPTDGNPSAETLAALAARNSATPLDDAQLGDIIGRAKQDLGQRLGLAPQAALLVSAQSANWPAEGEHPDFAETGFQIVLAADGKNFLYHADSEQRLMLADDDYEFTIDAAHDSSGWHNAADPLDTNRDGRVTPLDILIIVNELNARGPRALADLRPLRHVGPLPAAAMPRFSLDVDGDQFLAARDALAVINHLNRIADALSAALAAEGEGDEPDLEPNDEPELAGLFAPLSP